MISFLVQVLFEEHQDGAKEDDLLCQVAHLGGGRRPEGGAEQQGGGDEVELKLLSVGEASFEATSCPGRF